MPSITMDASIIHGGVCLVKRAGVKGVQFGKSANFADFLRL